MEANGRRLGRQVTHALAPKDHRILPDDLREALARPLGPVVDNAGLHRILKEDDLIYSIGDVVSLSLKGLGFTPKIWIGDFKTQRGTESTTYREALGDWGDTEYKVSNPAGTVTRDAWDAVTAAMATDGTARIIVDGEEDLVGIAVMLEAPDGAKICYGMPGMGAVVVTMDPAMRQLVESFVGQMPEP